MNPSPPPTTDPVGIFAWIDTSPFWATVIGTIVAAGILAFIAFLWGKAKKTSYGEVWKKIGRGIAGTWPVTTRTHQRSVASAFQAGIDSEKEKVAAERAQARSPKWHIDAQDRLGGHDLLWLENHGWQVKDVSMTCDPALFVLDGDTSWQETVGTDRAGYHGVQFRGQPTEQGRTQGVVFHVTWHDMNGDRHEGDVSYPPKEMRARDNEIRNEGYQEGREAGRAEVLAEVEAARTEFHERVTWRLLHDANYAPSSPLRSGEALDQFQLKNVSRTANAHHVRVTVAPEDLQKFVFSSSAQWEHIEATGPASGPMGRSIRTFTGVARSGGEQTGIWFVVTWRDEFGQEQEPARIFVDGWESYIAVG